MSLRQRLRRLLMTALVGVAAASGVSAGVDAHSDVEFTLPTDGASVAEPITEISIAFVQPVTLIGPGFEVLDPQGNLIVPFAVTDDDQLFRLQIDPPIGGGDVGVRFEVTAQDGHVITGSFSFTVSVPAPTVVSTTAAPETTAAPATTPPTAATTPPTAATTTPTVPTTVPSATATTTPASETTGDDGDDGEDGGDVGESDDDGDDGDNSGLYIAIALAVAIGALGFLGIRRSAAR